MASNAPFGFIAFDFTERDGSRFYYSVRILKNQESLENWKSSEETEISPTNVTHVTPSIDVTPSDTGQQIKSIIERFMKAMASATSTIAFTSTFAPAWRIALMNGKLLPHAKNSLSTAFEGHKKIAYSFSHDQFRELNRYLEELNELREAEDRLPDAILLGFVAVFDSYFAEIVKLFMSIHPEKYTDSDRQISMRDVFARRSLQEVIDHIIDGEIANLMRGSHTEQVRFVENNLSVNIIGHYERWPNFVEIFERRNLVAHGNLIVNGFYLDKLQECKFKSPPEIGTKLNLSPKYLGRSVNVLTEFNILLAFTLWRKHVVKSDEEAFSYMNSVCYQLIVRNRPHVSKNILHFLLNKQKRSCSEATYRMLVVNLANSYKLLKDEENCLKTIKAVDWSATKDHFQLCVAALEGDADKVIALMPSAAASKEITSQDFREWPVLRWVRDDEKVIKAFEQVYGEPMQPKVSESVQEKASPDFDKVFNALDTSEPSEIDNVH